MTPKCAKTRETREETRANLAHLTSYLRENRIILVLVPFRVDHLPEDRNSLEERYNLGKKTRYTYIYDKRKKHFQYFIRGEQWMMPRKNKLYKGRQYGVTLSTYEMPPPTLLKPGLLRVPGVTAFCIQ